MFRIRPVMKLFVITSCAKLGQSPWLYAWLSCVVWRRRQVVLLKFFGTGVLPCSAVLLKGPFHCLLQSSVMHLTKLSSRSTCMFALCCSSTITELDSTWLYLDRETGKLFCLIVLCSVRLVLFFVVMQVFHGNCRCPNAQMDWRS